MIKSFNEFVNEESGSDYYTLYHGTDSDFFTDLDFDKAAKGDRYNNPLGDGIYLTPFKEDAKKFFGKNVYVNHLPKSSNIKKVTKENWENDFKEIVSETIKRLGFNYEDLDQLRKNQINSIYKFQPTQILMLNKLTFLLENLYKIDKYDVADIIEEVMNERNEPYDAIWYDYGEVLIPTSKFNSSYFSNK